MSRDNGEAAFPSEEMLIAGKIIGCSTGMSLRDYFAAKAMVGLVKNKDALSVLNSAPEFPWQTNVADACYLLADAMLKARQA